MRFCFYFLHAPLFVVFRPPSPLNHPPAAPVDGARVLTAERHHVAPPAVRILGVEVRQRLPAATETDDLDIVLAAAVGDGFYDRVEAWDVAATSEDADSLFRHDDTSTFTDCSVTATSAGLRRQSPAEIGPHLCRASSRSPRRSGADAERSKPRSHVRPAAALRGSRIGSRAARAA